VKDGSFFVALLLAGATLTTQAEPFQVETLEEAPIATAAILPAPEVDFQHVFDIASKCGPTKSLWSAMDIKVRAGSNYREDTGNQVVTDEYGGHYIGIVAEMPLFTGAEVTRQRTEEEKRRQDIAGDVQNFKHAIAKYRLAQRLVGLYASLEQRSQTRIEMGVTTTSEQITYLEKTAKAWEDKIGAKSQVEQYRLALLSRCVEGGKRRSLATVLDRYFMEPAQ